MVAAAVVVLFAVIVAAAAAGGITCVFLWLVAVVVAVAFAVLVAVGVRSWCACCCVCATITVRVTITVVCAAVGLEAQGAAVGAAVPLVVGGGRAVAGCLGHFGIVVEAWDAKLPRRCAFFVGFVELAVVVLVVPERHGEE